MATVPICDFKLVHMCWEQLPVGEWADCVLIVCPRTEQDAYLKRKVVPRRRMSGWLNHLLLKVGEGGWVWGRYGCG